MPGGVSPDLLQPGPSFAPISATTTSSATSPSDQHDHARLGTVTRFYCSTQPGGLQPAIATGRSVVAQAPFLHPFGGQLEHGGGGDAAGAGGQLGDAAADRDL